MKLIKIILFIIIVLITACDQQGNINTEDRIMKAEKYFKNKEYSAAIIELKNVLKNTPDNYESRIILGEIYLAVGNGEAAEKELNKANEGQSGKPDLYLKIAQSLIQQGKYDKANFILEKNKNRRAHNPIRFDTQKGAAHIGEGNIEQANKLFNSILLNEPNNIDAAIGKIDIKIAKKEYESARNDINKILKNYPDHFNANIRKGEVSYLLKDINAAINAYKETLELSEAKIFTPKVFEITSKMINALFTNNNIEEAIQSTENLMKNAPGHPLPQYFRALGAYLEGEYQVAKDHLLSVLKVLPNHSPSLFLLGAVSYGSEDLEMAEMYLSKFVEKSPNYVPGRKLLGATRIKLDQPVEAIGTLLPIYNENPQDTQLLLLMGAASIGSSESSDGIKYLIKAVDETPDNVIVRNELATAYLKTRQYEKAVNELNAAVKIKNTTQPDATTYQSNTLLVYAYLMNNQRDQALRIAAELVGNNKDNPHAYTLLGHVKQAQGKNSEAEEKYRLALAKQPGYLIATLKVGEILKNKGQLQKAKDLYLESIKYNHNNYRLLLSLAEISEKLKDLEGSLDWLEKARASDKKAIYPRILLARYYQKNNIMWKVRELVAEAEESDPDHIAVMQMKGIIKLRENSPGAAVTIFNKSIKKHPKRPELYYLLSRAYLLDSKTEQARSSLQKAISIDSNFLPARLLMVSIELQLGKYKRGEELVVKIRDDFPKLSKADNLLGDLYMANRKYQKAATVYAAIPEQKQTSHLIVRQANALFKSKQNQKGYGLLEDWLIRSGDNTQVRTTLATAYQMGKQYNHAIRHYELIIAEGVEHPGIINNLAIAYKEIGDNRAQSFAEKAHKLAPENGRITDTLGWIMVKKGQYKEGLDMLRKAVKQAPGIPEIRYHLAHALHMSGDTISARRELTELLTSGINFEGDVEANILLKSMN